MLNDLLQAALFLLPIGAGVALLVILGRDRDDVDFDLADHHEPDAVDELVAAAPGAAVEPIPATTDTPLFDELAARPYVPLDDAAVRSIADEWLREFGDRARAELELAR